MNKSSSGCRLFIVEGCFKSLLWATRSGIDAVTIVGSQQRAAGMDSIIPGGGSPITFVVDESALAEL